MPTKVYGLVFCGRSRISFWCQGLVLDEREPQLTWLRHGSETPIVPAQCLISLNGCTPRGSVRRHMLPFILSIFQDFPLRGSQICRYVIFFHNGI